MGKALKCLAFSFAIVFSIGFSLLYAQSGVYLVD